MAVKKEVRMDIRNNAENERGGGNGWKVKVAEEVIRMRPSEGCTFMNDGSSFPSLSPQLGAWWWLSFCCWHTGPPPNFLSKKGMKFPKMFSVLWCWEFYGQY